MTAALERSALAEVGRDLIAVAGSAGRRRVATLTIGTSPAPPADFAALADTPPWLREPAARQVAFARLVAMRSIAPSLAASIDGEWLQSLAELVGEPAVDWAIASGDAARPLGDTTPSGGRPTPDELTDLGFAILAAQLPPALRCYLARTAGTAAEPNPIAIEDALAFLRERAA